MPAISPSLLNCTVYMYPSVEAATEGRGYGGSGFVVSLSMPHGLPRYFYAVTNRHVIDGGRRTNTVMRINLQNGGSRAIPTEVDAWTFAPDDDLAVIPFHDEEEYEAGALGEELFLAHDCVIDTMPLWPGDKAFFVGRFVTHDGHQRNKAVMRSGIIAMLSDDKTPVPMRSGKSQVAFLVEGLSVSGFSGSPAFVQLESTRLPGPGEQLKGGWKQGVRLLGVDCGHLTKWSRVLEADRETAKEPAEWVESNTGMAVVIPAWRLRALLDSPDLLQERERWVKRMLADRPNATEAIPDV